MQYKKNLFLFLFVVLTIPVFCRNIYSPLQFGLFGAKNGAERFWVLYNTHAMAVKENAKVSYDGIREIEIEIPEDAKCIPLPEQTDFSGITITVSNNSKDFYLFERVSSLSNISITPEDADKGDFSSYSMLNEGSHLLILSDLTPWVKNRIGYKYGHTRKDVLFVNNGISNILPISPYTFLFED